jgi:hypothetical protein
MLCLYSEASSLRSDCRSPLKMEGSRLLVLVLRIGHRRETYR